MQQLEKEKKQREEERRLQQTEKLKKRAQTSKNSSIQSTDLSKICIKHSIIKQFRIYKKMRSISIPPPILALGKKICIRFILKEKKQREEERRLQQTEKLKKRAQTSKNSSIQSTDLSKICIKHSIIKQFRIYKKMRSISIPPPILALGKKICIRFILKEKKQRE
eukprot:345920_1